MILNLEVSRAKVSPAYLLWSTRSEPQNTAVSTGVPQAAGPPHRISIVPRSRNGAIRSEILLLLEGRDGDAPRSAVLPNRKSGGHREIFQWRVKQDSSSTSTPHKAAPPPPVSSVVSLTPPRDPHQFDLSAASAIFPKIPSLPRTPSCPPKCVL